MGPAGPPDARALAFLPLVGIVIGGIAGAAAWGVSLLAPHGIAAAVAFALTIVLTGALHVDGFMDSCDALFAAVPPERRLEIMRDPRHGTFAVAGFVALSAVWLAALGALPADRLPALMAVCGGASRWGMSLNTLFVPYARPKEESKGLGDRSVALPLLLWWVILSAGGGAIVPGAVALVAGAGAAGLLLGLWARGRLGGGLTGDVYGLGITAIDVLLLAWQATMWSPRT